MDGLDRILRDGERSTGGSVVLAALSGSRADGTQRADSDHDVRAILVYPVDRLAGCTPPPDSHRVQEPGIDVQFHSARWFASNLVRSNPVALSILSSGHQVEDAFGALASFRSLAEGAFDPEECVHRLAALCRRSFIRSRSSGWDDLPCKVLLHPLRLIAIWDHVLSERRFPVRLADVRRPDVFGRLLSSSLVPIRDNPVDAGEALAAIEARIDLPQARRPVFSPDETDADRLLLELSTGLPVRSR